MTALEGADGFKSIPTLVDDSNWEPEGVTLQVRFCEGGKSRGWPLLSQPSISLIRRIKWIELNLTEFTLPTSFDSLLGL